MNPSPMLPHGLALKAYFEGDTDAELYGRRDDGQGGPMPVSRFFRSPEEFTLLENTALAHCRGRVLDVGAGTGLHSLVLQEKGFEVTAIDISPHAVEIMRVRGVHDAHCADIFTFQGGPFDTLLLMGHGIGMVETLAGLKGFLDHVRNLVAADGQILLESLDVRQTNDPTHLAYHEANRKAGRYIGEIRLQFSFGEVVGPYCGWLHVDPETLQAHAEGAGWGFEVLLSEENGDYLARLWKR